jgi:hypothetical protein
MLLLLPSENRQLIIEQCDRYLSEPLLAPHRKSSGSWAWTCALRTAQSQGPGATFGSLCFAGHRRAPSRTKHGVRAQLPVLTYGEAGGCVP